MRVFRIAIHASRIDAARAFYESVLGIPADDTVPSRIYFHCGDVILAVLDRRPEHGVPFHLTPDNLYFATGRPEEGTAQLTRILRANLLDDWRRPYVLTARAKGLSEKRVILKYPVRAALNPFASTVAYLFPYLVSGSVIISIVLSLPTVGPLLVRSLISQDMFLAGTIVLLLGVLTVIGTFISDLVLMWVDPRIRHQLD